MSWSWRPRRRAMRSGAEKALSASTSRSLCTNLAATTFLLPEVRMSGLVPA